MLKIPEEDVALMDRTIKNANMLVEISAWASGFRDVGFDAKTCMKRICEAMEREGYLRPAQKQKEKKRNE